MKIRLTEAQVSAMECRDWSQEPVVRSSWRGGSVIHLPEDDADREQLWRELNDASNAEDADGQENPDPTLRTYARRAARSLGCVASRVLCAQVGADTKGAEHELRRVP